MASSIIDIQTIYGTMLTEIVRDPDIWISFLNCAGMNYKYDFNEQLLIYSQRPNAIACAETKFWNERMHRWIKKGTKGIALFDSTKKSGLRYVFDVADTTDFYNRKLKLWEVKEEYQKDIIEELEANYGTLEEKNSFANSVLSAINNSIEDNIQDYFDILMENIYGSNLADMDELTIQLEYKSLLVNSVAYMVLARVGLNPFDYINREDFYYVQSFNSFNSIVTLGAATSDISENILRNIEISVKNIIKNKNRTFDKSDFNNYNKEKNKGRNNYERNNEYNIQTRGRLFNTKYSSTDTTESNWKIRKNENEIFEGEQKSNISIVANEQSIERPLDRDTKLGSTESGSNNKSIEDTREYNRGIERDRPNELGRSNEQYQEQSRGNSLERIDFQLENDNKRKFLSDNERKSKLDFLQDEYVSNIIANAELKESKEKIKQFYKLHNDKNERIEFVKNIFPDAYTEIVVDGDRLGFKTYDNVLHFWKGSYLNRTAEAYYKWENVADYINGMMLVNELTDLSKNIINIDNQIQLSSLIPDTTPPLLFTQELIDTALQNGSGFSNGKYRIYEQFNQSLSKEENIKFLKNEYGTGGGSSVHIGTNIGYEYGSKGIELYRGYFDDRKFKLLSWNEVEQRINELIKLDRYLNPKEKQEYSTWLNDREQKEILEENITAILEEDNKIGKNEIEKLIPSYEYHLGDTVFLGANEFEIINIGLFDITLIDVNFPMLNNVVPKEVFEKRLADTSANDHLLIFNNTDVETQNNQINQDIEKNVEVEKKQEDKKVDFEKEKVQNQQEKADIKDKNEDNELKPKFEIPKSKKIQNYNLHPEIAESERLNFKIKNEDLGVGTPKEKFERNVEAIKTLKKCEKENRYANNEEQEILSQYVGWGGLQEAFNENNPSWSEEYKILKDLLNDEEYENARTSTLTSFYTPPIVIESIYKALENMGLESGNVLEPSCRSWKLFGYATQYIR